MAQIEHITERDLSDYTLDTVNRRRISWGAILAGTIAALAVQLLFTLLGISIGAWVADPARGTEGMRGIGTGAGIWALVSFIIALFCGGWIAGRMAGLVNKLDGMLEGFLVWSAVTALSFMLLTSTIGNILGGAAGLAGNVMRAVPESVQNPENAVRRIQEAAQGTAQDTQTADATRQATEKMADTTATGSFWAFLALLLGALTAGFAGRLGGASGLRDADMAVRT
jgi:hypothetical protein